MKWFNWVWHFLWLFALGVALVRVWNGVDALVAVLFLLLFVSREIDIIDKRLGKK